MKEKFKKILLTTWYFVFFVAIVSLLCFALSSRFSKIRNRYLYNRNVSKNLGECYSYIEDNNPFQYLDKLRHEFLYKLDEDEFEDYYIIESAINNLYEYCEKTEYIANNHK